MGHHMTYSASSYDKNVFHGGNSQELALGNQEQCVTSAKIFFWKTEGTVTENRALPGKARFFRAFG